MTRPSTKAADTLRAFALTFPEATEDHPWGETAIKVRKKVFLFVGWTAEGDLCLSVKLPRSCDVALGLDFTAPTGYGLGKSGWVTARFAPKSKPPVGMLREWIAESYRSVAPKKLAALVAPPAEDAADDLGV